MAQLLYKNTASQKIIIYAYNSLTGAPATGIASTITGNISLDGAATSSLGNPSEIGNGGYYFAPSQGNTNADLVAIFCTTTTPNTLIAPVVLTTGAATPNVNVTQISGDSSAADNLELLTDESAYIDGLSTKTLLTMLLATLAGKVEGSTGGVSTITFYDQSGSALFSIETDEFGNRAAGSGDIVPA